MLMQVAGMITVLKLIVCSDCHVNRMCGSVFCLNLGKKDDTLYDWQLRLFIVNSRFTS